MGNAAFGWENHVVSGTLSAGSAVGELGVSNLATPLGDPSVGWQTEAGVVEAEDGAWFLVDAGADVPWRAFLLARTNLSPAAQVRWRVGAAEAIVEQEPLYDFDFSPDWTAPAGWTFTRSTKGWTFDAMGTLVEVAVNQPRFYYDPATLEYRGLLMEPARTNYVYNPRMEGAAVGAPGTLPTDWSHRDIPTGIDVEVAEVGTENGIPYIDLRFSGVAASAGTYKLSTMGFANRVAGTPNTAATRVTSSAFVKLAAGAIGGAAFQMCVVDRDSAQNFLQARSTAFVPTMAVLRTQRPWRSTGGNDGQDHASLFYSNQEIWIDFAAGVAEDFTLRIGAPNLCNDNNLATPNLGTAGSLAAFNRTQDSLISPTGALVGIETAGTVLAEGWAYRIAGLNTQGWFQMWLDDGTGTNRLNLRASSGGSPAYGDGANDASSAARAQATITVAGVSTSTPLLTYETGNPFRGEFSFAASWGDDLAVSAIGSEVAETAGVGASGGISRFITQGNAGQSGILCYRRVRLYAGQLTDTQLLSLSREGTTISGDSVTYDSGWIPAGVEVGYQQSVHVLEEEVIGGAARCDISDPANPDGFINVPLAFAGPLWQVERNIAWSTAWSPRRGEDRTRTRGGQEHVEPLWRQRAWSVVHEWATEAETWEAQQELDREAASGANILFIPEPGGPYAAREAVFGTLVPTSDVAFMAGTMSRSWRATVSERL